MKNSDSFLGSDKDLSKKQASLLRRLLAGLVVGFTAAFGLGKHNTEYITIKKMESDK